MARTIDPDTLRDRMLDLANTVRANPSDSIAAAELADHVLRLDRRLCEGDDLPEDWCVADDEEIDAAAEEGPGDDDDEEEWDDDDDETPE